MSEDHGRIADLERVLAALPMYSDNWDWAEKNIDVLKTVPGMRFPTGLEIKIGWLSVDENHLCHETGKRATDQRPSISKGYDE